MAQCKNKATLICPWGGSLIKCCKKHANHLAILSKAIGSPIEFQQILTDDQCSMQNLEEENK